MSHEIPVQIPLVVELTRYHVVWVDVEPEDRVEDVVLGWKDDPVEMLSALHERDALDYDYEIRHDPLHYLVAQDTGWVGPTFPSGAYSSDEEARYQDWVRRTEAKKAASLTQSGNSLEATTTRDL